MHICSLPIFREIIEKPEVIDTYYPWYGGAVVYKKYLSGVNSESIPPFILYPGRFWGTSRIYPGVGI